MHTIKLSDGKDRALKTGSVGLVKRLAKRLGLERSQLDQIPLEEIVFELLQDKDGIADAEAVADLIPFSQERIEELNRHALAALLDKTYEQIVAMEEETAKKKAEAGEPENPPILQ